MIGFPSEKPIVYTLWGDTHAVMAWTDIPEKQSALNPNLSKILILFSTCSQYFNLMNVSFFPYIFQELHISVTVIVEFFGSLFS